MSIIARAPVTLPVRLAPHARVGRSVEIIRPATPPAAPVPRPVLTVYRPASRAWVATGYAALTVTGGAAFFTTIYAAAGMFPAVLLTGTGAALAGIVTSVAVLAPGMVEGHADATAAGIADAYRPRPGVR